MDGREQPTVRDPLGRRPLVYTDAGGGLSAEHEHEILDRLSTMPAPDRLALKSWVDRGIFPAGRTLFEGIRRLPSGHRLRREDRSFAVERSWSPRYQGTLTGSREDLAEHLREEVFAAVARAAAGAGPTALRLSGGLDSAAVAAGLKSDGGGIALSLVFPDHPITDERPLIEATAAWNGLRSEQIGFEPGRPVLPATLAHIDRWLVPPASPNLSLWEPLTLRARELGVSRILDGEGGDELFGTVSSAIAERLRRGRVLGAWELCSRIPGMGEHPARALRLRALRRFGLNPSIPPGLMRARHRRRARSDSTGSILGADDRVALAELQVDRRPGSGPLWWRELVATLTGGDELDVAGHLRRETIEGGIERRHPFLHDLDLVETILRLPPALGFDPDLDRPLLRAALAGHGDPSVIRRKGKARFNPLLVEALAGQEGDRLATGLRQADAPIREFFDAAAIDRVTEARAARIPGEELRFWRLGIVDLWLRRLADR